MKYSLIFVLCFFFFSCFSQKEVDSVSVINTFSQLKTLFADPPSEYRSAPLWDWNDLITEEGIDFQMKEFKKAGIGGVFVHPRPGLITEYLSKDWFRLFDYTVEKGKELGMKVWIYDENSYPSGFAGGHVPAEMPDSYQHGTGLRMEIREELNIVPSDTIAVVLKKTDSGFSDITANLSQETGQKGTYYIFRKTYPGKSLWYGGYTYVDLLHKGVTDKFMEVTMTNGYEKNSADFGKTVMGVFTDEPNLEAAMPGGTHLRWTPDLWEVFRRRWGYDLKVNLPSLVEETGDWKKVRHDFYETLMELFVERWAKPWSEYCEKNNLVWTGHYWEHGWPTPTHGFDEAAFYIWHQMPGVDMLGNELVKEGQGGQFGNTRAVRELRSAANQAGHNRTLSETYGGGGWDMNFKKYKQLADWQGVLGVNFVNQHLSYYTLKGVRKFDYPPSFSYHEPWWNNYNKLGDYIGRISLAMSSGEQINSTLVLQPNTTAWMYFSRTKNHPKISEIQHKFKDFVYQLERNHVEYDLGSENVLKELGSAAEGTLTVGKRKYNLVIIPQTMENLDLHTLELLKEYLSSGGKVLSFQNEISRVDGVESNACVTLQRDYPEQWIVVESLNDSQCNTLLFNNEFSINEKNKTGELYYQRRILQDGQLLFFVNSDELEPAGATISAAGESVVKMNPENGQINLVPSTKENGKVVFNIQLEPVGSALYFVSERKENEPELEVNKSDWTTVGATGEIEVNAESENILVLNYLDLKTSKTTMKDTYFMTALISLFKENGVEFGNPWQHKIQYKKNYLELDQFEKTSGFTADYHFQIANGADISALSEVKAVVERPELWSVSINGHVVEKEPGEYWIDKDFPLFKIGTYLKPGENTISVVADRMSIFAELMPVYVIGDFKVQPKKVGFKITNGKPAGLGSWKDTGYIFYSDKVSYSQKFNLEKGTSDFKVKLKKWNGTVAEVLVNGEEAGIIAWEPEELDITKFLSEGENEITVRVVGSLKNTFGEFYREKTSWIYGPHGWNNAPEHQPAFDKYYIPDYGLFEPFELLKSALN
jgi:hypothetical protein